MTDLVGWSYYGRKLHVWTPKDESGWAYALCGAFSVPLMTTCSIDHPDTCRRCATKYSKDMVAGLLEIEKDLR